MRRLIGLVCVWAVAAAAAETTPSEWLLQGRQALQQGDRLAALNCVNKAIEGDDRLGEAYFLRGRLHSSMGNPALAVKDFDRVTELLPGNSEVYQWRGGELFRVNRVEEAIADFDRFLQKFPERDPHHWQRGIAYYYAGRFDEGSRQFERHQTVNSNDVENAVWHFLCLAKLQGVEKARERLIPIQGDSRVPMAQVHKLFAGSGSAEDVLQAAEAGSPTEDEKRQRLFYAHLYLGLYYEALGQMDKMRSHILAATGPFAMPHYMGDVARVHAQRRMKPREATVD